MTNDHKDKPQVKRYDCTSGGSLHCYGCYTMTEDALGDYVLFEDYAAISAQLSEARQQSEAEAIAYSSLSAEHERLKAQLSEAQARLADAESRIEQAQKQEPAAWAYRFDLQKRHDDVHDNDAYFEVVYRTHRELSPDDPFGKRGKDFDDAAETTETPLYAAPVAPAAQTRPCKICGGEGQYFDGPTEDPVAVQCDRLRAALSERDRMLGEAAAALRSINEMCSGPAHASEQSLDWIADESRAFLSAYDASKNAGKDGA